MLGTLQDENIDWTASQSWLPPDQMTSPAAPTPQQPAAPQPTDPFGAAEASGDPYGGGGPPPATSGGLSTPTTPSYTDSMGATGYNQPGTAQPRDAGTDYTPLVNRLNTTQDPAQQAVARDELARTLQADIEADGHTVTWKNGVMHIDGRPYEIGSNESLAATPPEREQPAQDPNGPWTWQVGHDGTTPEGLTREQWRDAWMTSGATNPQQAEAWFAQHGGQLLAENGMAMTPFGEMLDLGEAYKTGAGRPAWTRPGGSPPSTGGLSWLRNMQGGSGSGGSGGTGAWQPGDGADDFTGLFDQLDPNAGDLPTYDAIYEALMSADPNEQATSDLVRRILENPESLDERTVEMLKSRNAEEIAMASQAQDDELLHFGGGAGMMDSPWLAGQRAGNAWDRRSATVQANRDVDLSAAEQRGADRRSAASLGSDYGKYRTGKVQTAITTAVEGTLGKLGEQRSRTQLNNAFKEAAARLGMTKDQLVLEYIDINNRYEINMAQLSQQSSQFQADLAHKIAQLKQQDEQFGADFELRTNEFNERKSENAWERARTAFDPTVRRG